MSPVPHFHPRSPDEWQGMLVDTAMQAICDESRFCGLAMACLGERCGPCSKDADCLSGEVCVLDHCVLSSLARCRTRRDCQGDAMCVLSGYSSDARGNSDMTASCIPRHGGRPQRSEDLPVIEGVPAAPAPVLPEDLLESLRDADR
jgi:hypothetical protein